MKFRIDSSKNLTLNLCWPIEDNIYTKANTFNNYVYLWIKFCKFFYKYLRVRGFDRKFLKPFLLREKLASRDEKLMNTFKKINESNVNKMIENPDFNFPSISSNLCNQSTSNLLASGYELNSRKNITVQFYSSVLEKIENLYRILKYLAASNPSEPTRTLKFIICLT